MRNTAAVVLTGVAMTAGVVEYQYDVWRFTLNYSMDQQSCPGECVTVPLPWHPLPLSATDVSTAEVVLST